MEIKQLFDNAENGTLTWEQFQQAAKDSKAKFVDLSDGKYVSKQKYDDDLATKASEIDTLNGTISTRDTDLANLQKQLEEAGTDSEKLTALTDDLTKLQTKYDDEVKSYKQQLKQQAYQFAVKDFANTKKFTSNAAKRDFIKSMLDKGLKMEKDTILGADDFVTAYSKDNEDAFVKESSEPDPIPTPAQPKPQFVNPTPGQNPAPKDTNEFVNAFKFTGVRPAESK